MEDRTEVVTIEAVPRGQRTHLLDQATRFVGELRLREMPAVWVHWQVRDLLSGASTPIRDLPIELTELSEVSQAQGKKSKAYEKVSRNTGLGPG